MNLKRPLLNLGIIHWIMVAVVVAAALLLHWHDHGETPNDSIGLYFLLLFTLGGVIIHARTQSHD